MSVRTCVCACIRVCGSFLSSRFYLIDLGRGRGFRTGVVGAEVKEGT